MNALATTKRTPDDSGPWTPSILERLPHQLPPIDPVQQLLAEEQRDQARLRLLLSATAAVLTLLLAGSLLA